MEWVAISCSISVVCLTWVEMWYIFTMNYYSAIKRNKIGSSVVTWMDPESVIQSKVSQKEENKYCIVTCVCEILKDGTDESMCRAGMEVQL